MKKFLLSLAAGCLSFAGINAQTAAFVASGTPEADYTCTMTGSIAGSTQTAGDITAQFVKVNSSATNVNGELVRWYANDQIIISGIDGALITNVTMEASTASYGQGISADGGTLNGTTWTWSNETGVETLTLTATKQVRFKYFTVTYKIENPDTRKDAGLTFTGTSDNQLVVELGNEFESPVATAFEGAVITYTIDNTDVATVDAETGALTIIGAGNATVTATSEETEEYKKGEASYALVVTDPNALDASFNFISEVSGTSFSEGIVSADFAIGDGSTAPAWFSTGTAMRLYAGNTLTISVKEGYALKAVEFTTASGSNSAFNDGTTASFGTLDGLNWTCGETYDQNTVVFKNGGSKGHVRIQTITVHYTKAEEETAVSTIDTDSNAPAIIYDLNGRQVKGQPAAGIYVVRQGNKTYKVVVK